MISQASPQTHNHGNDLVVGVADIRVSNDPDAVIVTYALGSCIAVCLYDPGRRTGGIIHYMLPDAKVSAERAEEKPAMFADTGVPLLFKTMYAMGSNKKDLVVKVAGGSAVNNDGGLFNIGKRNHTALRKLFWKNGVIIAAEDVGGCKSRTVRLHLTDGTVTVSSQGKVVEL